MPRHLVTVLGVALALGCRPTALPPTPAAGEPVVAPQPAPPPAAATLPEAPAVVPVPGTPEPPPEGASAGLRLHHRDTTGLRPGDVVTGSGAPPAPVPGPAVAMGAPSGVSDLDHARRVVAGLQAGFRRCYQRALDVDPTMVGAFALETRIGPKGEVTGVSVKGQRGVAVELSACLSAVVRRAQFAPQEGTATLTVPFTITRQ